MQLAGTTTEEDATLTIAQGTRQRILEADRRPAVAHPDLAGD